MTSRETGHEPEAREVPPPRRWQLTVGAFTLGALVVLVDQGTKTWAEATLTEGERVPLIGNLLGLQLAYNPGAAFSFLASAGGWRAAPAPATTGPDAHPATSGRAPRPTSRPARTAGRAG